VKKKKRPVSEAGNTAKKRSIAREWAGKPRKGPEEKQSEKVRKSALTTVKQQRQHLPSLLKLDRKSRRFCSRCLYIHGQYNQRKVFSINITSAETILPLLLEIRQRTIF
jgi:hypothetical protein